MSKVATKEKTYPFTLRLTAAQRAMLERKADNVPLGEYIRLAALNEPVETMQLSTKQEQTVARWILGNMGQDRCCEHLGTIAKASQQGLVILSPEESAVVIQACADISAIRQKLMRILGHRKAANDH